MTAAATAVDAFGVSAEQWELIEGNLFGASLLPYLVFLYYLGMPESKMPPRALFGFKFLLVFVFGTIPCAIYAKLVYNDILANVDWLHGPAESLLTITNLFIVVGMREGLRDLKGGDGGKRSKVSSVSGSLLGWSAAATTATLAAAAAGAGGGIIGGGIGNVAEAAETAAETAASAAPALGAFFAHAEPANALSLPTWIIHVSSLIEWLVAMGLIWEYADATGNQKYKGLTWGMVPCHASGIAACTFHLFYNSPALNSVVATQAGLTVLGNTTVAIAAYRIAIEGGAVNTLPWEDGFVAPWKKDDAVDATSNVFGDEVRCRRGGAEHRRRRGDDGGWISGMGGPRQGLGGGLGLGSDVEARVCVHRRLGGGEVGLPGGGLSLRTQRVAGVHPHLWTDGAEHDQVAANICGGERRAVSSK